MTQSLAIGIQDIEKAAEKLKGRVIETPMLHAPMLSDTLEAELYLKLENLQYTSSFKARGACLAIDALDEPSKQRGVITMSAGNHAQAVAYRASEAGIKSVIVMPQQTPFAKVSRTEQFGGIVLQEGRNLNECESRVKAEMDAHGYSLIHPYDNPHVMAGQGTVGLEMMAAVPDLDCLIVPIGGGGLISGIAIAAKSINPNIKIYGVEAELYPSMSQQVLDHSGSCGGETLAEGIAVKTPGGLTAPVVKELVDDILLVSETALEWAVGALVEQQRIVAEGAGAAGIAALYQHKEHFKGQKVGIVICGGNIDTRLMGSILTRNMVSDGRLTRLRIDISDEPDMLAAITDAISACGGNIVEVYHQRLFYNVPAKLAKIDVVVDTRGPAHVQQIINSLHDKSFTVAMLDEHSG